MEIFKKFQEKFLSCNTIGPTIGLMSPRMVSHYGYMPCRRQSNEKVYVHHILGDRKDLQDILQILCDTFVIGENHEEV